MTSRNKWEIELDTWPRKVIAIVLTLSACGFMFYQTWWLFLAAWITRDRTPDPAIYERAIEYDPENADYRFALAQIYNYSTLYLDLDKAKEQYLAAVRLNPYRSGHWLELSKFYEQEGDVEASRGAMGKALEMDPNWAQMHWAAANLYIRMGDLEAADFELRRTADLDVSYLTQVLDLVWRFYEDPEMIVATHVPNTKGANLTAMGYFIGQNSELGAELAWNRLRTFETRSQERFPYVEFLVNKGQPLDAYTVFVADGPPFIGFRSKSPLNISPGRPPESGPRLGIGSSSTTILSTSASIAGVSASTTRWTICSKIGRTSRFLRSAQRDSMRWRPGSDSPRKASCAT